MDRKTLARKYKETPRPMGVYRILNPAHGKALVGTSPDLPSALNRHRAELRMGAHRNRQLQDDWDALGPDAFRFETLDTLAPSDEPGYDPTDDLHALADLWTEKLGSAADARY